jgi:hypothetical protein
MQFVLRSSTDAAVHVLYDPGAAAGRRGFDTALLERAAPDGRVLLIDTGSDGELWYRVYVEEPLPDELRARVVRSRADLLLRVPTGRLVACGAEELDAPGASASSALVPPGSYLVAAHDLDFDWDRDVAPALAREAPAGYRREAWARPLSGALLSGGGLTTVVAMLLHSGSAVLAGLGALFGGAVAARRLLPGSAYQRMKREIEGRFPPLVLVFTRLPDDADLTPYRGGARRA